MLCIELSGPYGGVIVAAGSEQNVGTAVMDS